MIRLAWRLALRDLRGARGGLFIVLLCLGLGVAAVAAIGSLRAALDQGIAEDGRGILGGDIELSTGLAPFPPAIAAWFRQRGARVSETIDTRSILIAPSGRRLLAAIRAVSPDWPLLGAVTTRPAGAFAALARPAAPPPPLLLDPTAAASLGLRPGDTVALGGLAFTYRGAITESPDRIGDNGLFGVKTLIPEAALAASSLIQPGGLTVFTLQVALPPGASPGAAIAAFRAAFPGNPYRLRDAAAAAPDLKRFVDQTTLFMTLLGLAALLVGGIGVANGVEAWLAARASGIATLRCLGASARLVGLILSLQLAVLACPGILAGLAAGALAPRAAFVFLRGRLPLPAHFAVYPKPLILAAIFGVLIGALFAQPKLRRAAAIPGAALFRQAVLPAKIPVSWRAAALRALIIAALIVLAARTVPDPKLAIGFCAATGITFLTLSAIAALIIRVLPRLRAPGGAPIALGLRRLHGPASSLRLMLLSAGAGLTILVAVAQIRGNLVAEFTGALPQAAPSFFFIDIQPDDLPVFQAALKQTGAASAIHTMPSLRARILAIAGTPVDAFHPPPDAVWPLRSDLAFTYAATPPEGSKLTAGVWWPADYLGPPKLSFDANIARAWHLHIGDTITVDVLGRRFDLVIANLRDIDWQSLQLNFLMIGTPDPFAGAPHTIIATVKAEPGRAGDILAAVTDKLPGVTGIDVSDILHALAGLLGEVATAISLTGFVALAAGALVLISAIAAEREALIHEAVILKTLGATRAQIRMSWLIEFAVAGAAAGATAAILGTMIAALTTTQIFHAPWRLQPGTTLATIGLSIFLMLALGFFTTARALAEPAAARLRREAGV
jgi:putative ABC transport system permease protein